MNTKKILIVGFPNAGKTCITKAFFEGEDPEKLLSDLGAPEPTLGIQHYRVSWIDTEVGIVDSSGQEILRFLEGDELDKEMTFGAADAIIYVFDIENWMEDQETVIENLKKSLKVRDEMAPDAKVFTFCHKIDLIALDLEKRASIFEEIKKKIQEEMKIKTIFTSIEPRFIHTLFRSMQIILNDLSKKGSSLEDFIKEILLNHGTSALILLNNEYRVISERRSKAISVVSMYRIITFVKAIDKAFRKIDNNDVFDRGKIESNMGMKIVIKSLKNNSYGVKFVIMASETASLDTVEKIIGFIENK